MKSVIRYNGYPNEVERWDSLCLFEGWFGFLLLFPIAIEEYLQLHNLKSFETIGLWIGFISVAMVSNLPTFSGKVFQIPKSFVIPLLIVLALLSLSLIHI